MDTFNLVLKERTAQLHRAVESTGISMSILSPALNQDMYANYLERILGIHSAVETTVFPVLQNLIPDLDQRRKTPAIRNDLKHLERADEYAGDAMLDAGYKNATDFNLGIVYVSEGSILGGQFILKHVKQVLGNDAPVEFLNVYGAQTGPLWKQFLECLNTYASAASDAQKQQIIAGAEYGFRRVEHLFSAGKPA